MALIPLDMLQRINKPDLTPIRSPNQDQLEKTIGEMSNILHDDQLPDDTKSSRFNEKIKDFTIYADKITTPTAAATAIAKNPIQPTFSSLPKTFQQPAKILLTELERFPNRVNWSNNELTVDGKRLVGSNLVDLVGDVLRNRKTASSQPYMDTFLQLLADLNVPETFIRNKNRLARFRSLKTVNESDDYPRKLEILKQRREKSSKSKIKKKTSHAYKWTSL